ncbi:MAG: hypothetical protein WGN25_05705 [Candidatus Electrothrix sp. GW3-4]|uniref:hypothetical protein n=1 Tax=Candidatus Electrothrix sp. GW3-4 TaxID=3126740 RepID=UPI0030CF5DD7
MIDTAVSSCGAVQTHDCRDREERCFITKDIYGDMYSSEVKILSSFKDNVLIKNRICKEVVSIYYSDFGKKVAAYIKIYFPFMIPLVRKFLNGVIYLILVFWTSKSGRTKCIDK